MSLRLGLVAALACAVTGCASLTGSDTQHISLQTFDASGNHVSGADCRATNNHGTWMVKSPGSVPVKRSAEDLDVMCQHGSQEPGKVTAVSRANTGMYGNILFGGVVGAVIDHSKGTAYDYPQSLRVIFGLTRIVDKGQQEPDAGPAALSSASAPGGADPPSASAAPPGPVPVSNDRTVTLDDLGGLLPAK